jgi:membrane protease YdiL (CAAX protease family)
MQMQARSLVGMASLNLPGASRKEMYRQARASLDRGSYSQRLRFAVLASELVGPERALDVLGEIERDRDAGKLESSEAAVEAADRLKRLYEGYLHDSTQPSLPEEDQEGVRSRLGWFGELALAPPGGDPGARADALAPARRSAVVILAWVAFGLIGLCVGGFLLLVFLFMAYSGWLKGGLTCGTGHGGIYAETFALYLVLYLGMLFALRFVPLPAHSLWASGLIMFLSLTVLLWPVWRGISWRQVREDIGLGLYGEPLGQVLSGPACYLAALPLVLVGLGVMLALMYAQKQLGLGDPLEKGGPSHPIGGLAMTRDPWVWVQLFLVACVAAPVVEEIMFRGVLYRHLREANDGWGGVRSILISALLSSFVFAIIHPQGFLGAPVLMALATAFALAREWRQSLLPSMIAHGINNGIATVVLLLAAA